MADLLSRLQEFIEKYELIKAGERVVVGVSGGPDSLALLHLLLRFKEKLDFQIHVAHLDHSFRGKEAEDEALWVEKTAHSWGIPCTLAKKDVPFLAKEKGLSSQEAGHLAREEFFLHLRDKLPAQKIALGHHANDQAETVLLHFLNGTGLEGLRGILPKRGSFIRPLLSFKKEEIEAYCNFFQLEPRRDPSNQKTIYLRNKIRLELIPWIETHINSNIVDTLNRTATIFWAEEEYLKERVLEKSKNCLELTTSQGRLFIEEWKKEPLAIKRRLIRHLYQAVCTKEGLDFHHTEEVRKLAEEGEVGKTLQLPGRILVEKEYNALRIYSSKSIFKSIKIEKRELNIPGSTYIPETGEVITGSITSQRPQDISLEKIYIPYSDKLQPLYVQSRWEGARIAPKGLGGTKKLKDWFIDKKIPREKRNKLLVVTMNEEILWIPGLVVSEQGNKEGDTGVYLILERKN